MSVLSREFLLSGVCTCGHPGSGCSCPIDEVAEQEDYDEGQADAIERQIMASARWSL